MIHVLSPSLHPGQPGAPMFEATVSLSQLASPRVPLPSVAGRAVVVHVDVTADRDLDTGLMARIVAAHASLLLAGARAIRIDAPPTVATTLASLGLNAALPSSGASPASSGASPASSSWSISALLRPIVASVR